MQHKGSAASCFVGEDSGCRGARIGVVGAAIAVLLVAAWVELARGDAVLAGSDLFATSSDETRQDLSLPGGFFGPGSDPFIGTVHFAGDPISPGTLGPTDTAVERLADANVAAGNTVGVTIPIEIVALSLVSVNPITVTYGGGSPESWNVRVCLDPAQQTQGTMTIRHEHVFGGTYVATLPVHPTLVFTRVSPPGTKTLDPGSITFESAGYWSHQTYPPFNIVTTGATVVPNPCGGLPAFDIPATSNFFAGFRVVDSTSTTTPSCYGKALTCEEQALARHGILPPQAVPPPHEGVVKFVGTDCILSTPGIGSACGGTYCGDNTRPRCVTCTCPGGGVPIVRPIGIVLIGVLTILLGIPALLYRRRSLRRVGQV